nr:hypothetical protein [Stenotrophomonas maltophilia]
MAWIYRFIGPPDTHRFDPVRQKSSFLAVSAICAVLQCRVIQIVNAVPEMPAQHAALRLPPQVAPGNPEGLTLNFRHLLHHVLVEELGGEAPGVHRVVSRPWLTAARSHTTGHTVGRLRPTACQC